MLLFIPFQASLRDLDKFLRNIWLECCGHLSCFRVNRHNYFSHTESGTLSRAMNKKIGKVLPLGAVCHYVYDMGQSTDLNLQIIGMMYCGQNKIELLMRNEQPIFECELCRKKANLICAFCGEPLCSACRTYHACAVAEDNTCTKPFLNSPRSGVCGYEG